MISKRAGLFIIAAMLLCAAGALAHFGQILSSFRAPILPPRYTHIQGIAWDGNYIWLNCGFGYEHNRVFRCVPSTGSYLSSFESPFHEATNNMEGRGISKRVWNGQPCLEFAVYNSNTGNAWVYRLNYAGTIIGSFLPQIPANNLCIGADFNGTNYWLTSPIDDSRTDVLGRTRVYKVNANGNFLSSFTVNTYAAAEGLALEGNYLWIPGDSLLYGACKVTTTGSVVASFNRLHQSVADCAYENNHLWIAGQNDYVYCIDVRISGPGIEPSSLGRVKALYR
jgi:hypothetical protein